MSTRSCKGYLVECKNPAVKGRLFCFTCAGRKSRNKKNLALETCERECTLLRSQLSELIPQLEYWKQVALERMSVRDIPCSTKETQTIEQSSKLEEEVSGAATTLLSFLDANYIDIIEKQTISFDNVEKKLSWDAAKILIPPVKSAARAEGLLIE